MMFENMKNVFLRKKNIGGTLGLLLIIVFFVVASWLSSKYEMQLQNTIGASGLYGMLMYVLITTVAIVVAPVSTLPLIPIAVSMWGWIVTGMLSVIGWVIGSQIAFHLARAYGRELIQKFVPLNKLEKMENQLPDRNIFWTIVLLRMTIPVDVLSYALGLFSNITSKSYFFATVIGVTPFAFFFAYSGSLPLGFQIITLIEVLLFISIVYWLRKKFIKK